MALAAALRRIGQVQPHLPVAGSILVAIIVAGIALAPWLWVVTQHVTTIAHEGAHATMGSLLGLKVNGMSFKADGSGATLLSSGGYLTNFSAGVVGYLGPSAFGIGAAALINAGYIVAVLWIGLAGLLLVMTVLRRSFGVFSVIVAFLVLFGIAGFASVTAQVLTAYAVTWFLLVSGVWVIQIHGKQAFDAGALREMTKIPAGFWSRLWLTGSVVALIFGATLLV